MDANDKLACEIVWREAVDSEPGWELVEALECPDPCVRFLVQRLLVENGDRSMDLLERAVVAGAVRPQVAGPCMDKILGSRQARETVGRTIMRYWVDVSRC